MGDNNVTLVVTFFGILLITLIGMYNIYYTSPQESESTIQEWILKTSISKYIGALHISHTPDQFQTTRMHIRDIKQMISHAQNMPTQDILPQKRYIRPLSETSSLPIRTSPKKQPPSANTGDMKAFALSLSSPTTSDIGSISSIPKNKQISQKREVDVGNDVGNVDDNTGGSGSTTTAAFMVIVLLPGLVIILLIAGLVVSHMWSDLLFPGSHTSLNEDGLDIGLSENTHNKYSLDIESGIALKARNCIKRCTLTSRNKAQKNRGVSKSSKRIRRTRRKRRTQKKNVRFGADTLVNYSPYESIIRTPVDKLLSTDRRDRTEAARKITMTRSLLNDILSSEAQSVSFSSGTRI